MAEIHSGWLVPDLITLDDEYQGRYTLWRNTLETGSATADIPQTTFLSVGDAGFDKGLAMLTTCLNAIPPNGLSASHTLPYLIDWLLFALGHPSTSHCPSEPHGCSGAVDRRSKPSTWNFYCAVLLTTLDICWQSRAMDNPNVVLPGFIRPFPASREPWQRRRLRLLSTAPSSNLHFMRLILVLALADCVWSYPTPAAA